MANRKSGASGQKGLRQVPGFTPQQKSVEDVKAITHQQESIQDIQRINAEMVNGPGVAGFKNADMTQNMILNKDSGTSSELSLAPLGGEIGVARNSMMSSFWHEEVNTVDVSVDDLQKMCRKDGQASAIYRILTLPIRAASWQILPAEGGEEEAKFVAENFTAPAREGGMETPLNEVIAYCCRAVRDGFAAFEKVWKVYNGKYVYKKIASREPNTIVMRTDDYGEPNGMTQRATFQGRFVWVIIPKEKSFIFRVNKEENKLYGQSLMLPCYYHYDKKHKLYYISNLAYSISAVPIRLGKVSEFMMEERPDLVNAFRQALADVGLNTAVTFPEGFEVDKFEATRPLADFMPLINHHDTLMAKSTLAQFLELGTNGNGGAYSLSKDQSDIFIVGLQAIMNDLEDTINSLIPDLIDLNFGTRKYPKFKLEQLSDTTEKLLRETFSEVMRAQPGAVTPEFLMELERKISDELGLKIDYGVIQAEAIAMRKQQMINAVDASTVKAQGSNEKADLGKNTPGSNVSSQTKSDNVSRATKRDPKSARLSELEREVNEAIETLSEYTSQ